MSQHPFVRAPSPAAPYYVSWELTHRCDARCHFCYAAAGPEADAGGELTTGEALSVIDRLAEAGGLLLAFSGGEPLLRDDWRQLIRYAIGHELLVTVITNGWHVGPQEAADLRQLGVESVTVSLDSHRPEVHDELRQLPGLHARALEAIRHLVAESVRVVVNFTPTRRNWKELAGLVELCHELGVDALSLSEFVPVGRGTPEMGLSPSDLQELLADWERLREAFRGRLSLVSDDRSAALLPTAREGGGCPECGAGRTMARIDPRGVVNPCSFLPVPLGSLRSETLSEVWQRASTVREARSLSGDTGSSCAECGMLLRSLE